MTLSWRPKHDPSKQNRGIISLQKGETDRVRHDRYRLPKSAWVNRSTGDTVSLRNHPSLGRVFTARCTATGAPRQFTHQRGALLLEQCVRTSAPTLWTHGFIVQNISSRAHPNRRRRFPPFLFILFPFFVFPHCFSLLMQGQFSMEITLFQGNSNRN